MRKCTSAGYEDSILRLYFVFQALCLLFINDLISSYV